MTSPSSCLAILFVVTPLVASAQPLDQADDLATVRSQIGWGTSVNPDRVGVWTEGGYNGGDHRAEVDATVEAAVLPRASVFATSQFGGEYVYSNPRPSVGAAYQIVDPRNGPNGARVTVAYKPEGFTESEGEIESVLVLSRKIRSDTVRVRVAYGQDPEGRESDAEGGGSFMHRATDHIVVGASSRYRHAIKVKTNLEPRWDLISGAVCGYVAGRSRVEVLVGVDSIAYTPSPAQTGMVGLLSVGTEL
jgi:hypothetical protein